jgi:hypothetical protein
MSAIYRPVCGGTGLIPTDADVYSSVTLPQSALKKELRAMWKGFLLP